MIRWKYVGPRLVLLALVCLACSFAVDPLIRRSLVRWGQSITGAKVELGQVRTSLLGARLQLADLKVADPRRPAENLIQLGEATLDLEIKALWQRKFVVERAVVRGLQFHSPRQTSGALDERPGHLRVNLRPVGSRLADLSLSGLRQAGTVLGHEIESQLESVAVTREMIDRWSSEYQGLRQRAESFAERVERIRERVQGVGTGMNPLRHVTTFQEVLAELAQIQRDLDQLPAELERLGQQLTEDRQRVEEAVARDAQRIRQMARLDQLDAATLSHYLLGRETGDRIAMLLGWIRVARRYVPRKAEGAKPVRGRGRTIEFAQQSPGPDLLFRSLLVEGEGSYRGSPYRFVGRIEGLTHQPWLYEGPTRLAAQTRGALEMELQLYLDNGHDPGHDRIAIRLPRLPQPELVLGRPDELALRVAGGTARVWAVLDLVGDQVAGKVTFQRDDLELSPTLGPRFGGDALADRLAEAVGDVHNLNLTVSLSGKLPSPHWTLESDFGRQLAASIHRVVGQELQTRRDLLLAELDKQVESEMAALQHSSLGWQREITEELQHGNQQINRVKGYVASRIRLPGPLVGKDSPIGRLLR